MLKRRVNYETGVFCSREPSNPETGKEVNLSMPYLTPLKSLLDIMFIKWAALEQRPATIYWQKCRTPWQPWFRRKPSMSPSWLYAAENYVATENGLL